MGKDASEIRREIEQTRARLGDTVDAIAYKSDLPARVRDSVDDKIETVKETLGGLVGGAKETLTGAGEKVGDALGDATRSVADTLPDTADVKHAARRSLRFATEEPLRVTLGALAVGVLAGLVLPKVGGRRS